MSFDLTAESLQKEVCYSIDCLKEQLLPDRLLLPNYTVGRAIFDIATLSKQIARWLKFNERENL